MKVTEKKKDKNKVVLEAVANPEEVERAFEAAYFSFAQQAGLQPEGMKTIAEIAEEKLDIKNLDAMVESQVVEYLTPFAVDKKNLMPAYPPKVIKKAVAKKGQDFEFTLEVALKNDLKLSSYDPVTIKIPPFNINETEIDNQIKQMAESYSDFVAIDPRPARMGDSCLLNIRAEKNGFDVESLNAENTIYDLGSWTLGEGFDDQIIGMNAHEVKEFPLSYQGPETEMDDPMVECIVELLEVREKSIPVIDDEWISVNIPTAKTLEGFKNFIREEFKKSYSGEYEDMKRQLATEELAKRYEGDIDDEAMLAMQQTIMNNLRMKLQEEGSSLEDYIEKNGGEQQFNLSILMQSKDSLAQGYALDALFLHNKFSLTDEDIIEACKTFDPENPNLVRKQMEYSGCGYMLRETAERMKASKWLIDNAEIVEEALMPTVKIPTA